MTRQVSQLSRKKIVGQWTVKPLLSNFRVTFDFQQQLVDGLLSCWHARDWWFELTNESAECNLNFLHARDRFVTGGLN